MPEPDQDAVNPELLRDPYEVLGVPRTATAQELKTAYRKLALQLHPDKNQGASAEAAAEGFKEVATAYGILGDADKRRRYDAGGYASLEKADLEVEVDLSTLGIFKTAVAAMFSKFVPIKTTIAPQVLEAAFEGRFEAAPLRFGEAISSRVEKAGAQYYALDLAQRHIDAGFAIGAHSVAGSKFKLLMFEANEAGQWELLLQEDSTKVRKATQIAGLYFLKCDTFCIGPKPSPLETADFPENVLFRRLDGMQPREKPVAELRPGRLLLAVYGDNWFKRVSYTVEAVLPGAAPATGANNAEAAASSSSLGTVPASTAGSAVERVQRVEADLLRRRDELRAFEADYRQAQTRYLEAVERFGALKEGTDTLLAERDDAYLELLAVPSPRSVPGSILARSSSSSSSAAAVEDGGHLQVGDGVGERKGLFGGLFGKKQ